MSTSWLILLLIGTSWSKEPLAVAHPDEKFEADRTVIWTPTFQAGWDAMNGALGGTPEESGSELGELLDTFEWQAGKVMPEGRWKVWAGEATTELAERANREAAAFLKEMEGPFREVEGEDGSIAFYSLLDAGIAFEQPFFESHKVGMDFVEAGGETRKVVFWGVQGEDSGDYRRQVRVLSWRPTAGFKAVELRGKDPSLGSLVLFQPPSDQSFATACRWIRTWRKHWEALSGRDIGEHSDRSLHERDQLRVPYLKIGVVSDFSAKLKGGRIYGRLGDPFTVSAARQRVNFEMDGQGARVRAVAEGGMKPFGGPPPTVPRDFSFDRPFFVFLWRDQSEWPYFATWVGDACGMVQFGDE